MSQALLAQRYLCRWERKIQSKLKKSRDHFLYFGGKNENALGLHPFERAQAERREPVSQHSARERAKS